MTSLTSIPISMLSAVRGGAPTLREAIAGFYAVLDRDDLTLARALVPILVVHSGGDTLRHFVPLASQGTLTLGVTVGAGHFSHLEVPDQVNAMIDRFVAMTTVASRLID